MEKQKHILFISSWYPNRNNPTHGIFNFNFAQAASLNFKVSVLHVCSESDLKEDVELVEENENNIFSITVYYKKLIHKIPVLSQFLKRKIFLRAFELGFQNIKENRGIPDLIQLNVVFPAGIGASYLSEKYKIPLVVNEGWTGYMPEDGSYRNWIHKMITKRILSKAKVIMPVSTDLESAMKKHGLNGNYRVVPNVINTDEFIPGNNAHDQITRFIHISTLDPKQKNVIGIIRAFQNALLKQPNLELTIIGEGEEKIKLQKQFGNLVSHGKIKFIGQLLAQELVKEINKHNTLIMFSNYESFCVVIAEALACGKPVITSKAGGLTSEILPEFGITIEKGNEAELTRAILRFCENRSNYKAVEIRKYAVEHFSQPVIAKKLVEIYNSVLS